jgi:sialic acid synthase SpsE
MKIIAELCQNHNGSFRNLLEMVDTARSNGADFAKIQAIYSSELVFLKAMTHNFLWIYG